MTNELLEQEDDTLVTCSNCDAVIPADAGIHEVDGYHYCAQCYREEFTQCYRCGDVCARDGMVALDDGGLICQDCYDNHYFTCEDCDGVFDSDDMHSVDGRDRYVCADCFDNNYLSCTSCGDSYHENRMSATYNGRYVCRDCRGEYYTCSSCSCYYHPDAHGAYSNDDGEDFCPNCAEESHPSCLHVYSHRPYIWTYHSVPTLEPLHAPFYGLELETDGYSISNTRAAERIDSAHGNPLVYFMKEDGSLSNGIEFVYHPRTRLSWEQYLPSPAFSGLVSAIRSHGGKSYDISSCGIHIHRSLADLTRLDISKLIMAMIRLQAEVRLVAQRYSESYATFDFWQNATASQVKYVHKKNTDGTLRCARYVALNLSNSDTIEFRVFRGTLKTITILAYIQFCDTLTDWVKLTGITTLILKDRGVLWRDYLNYVIATGHSQELLTLLDRKNLIAGRGVTYTFKPPRPEGRDAA